MNKIIRATIDHCDRLSEIAKTSFLDAHGASAPKEDIDGYIAQYFDVNAFSKELKNAKNQYYLIFHEGLLAGYSKAVFNIPNENIGEQNVTKLERFYLLKDYYGKGLASQLLNFNGKISQENNQKGIWLAVWIENHRAIRFYTKNNFRKVGSYDFHISATHANPNHIMYWPFGQAKRPC